MFIPYIGFATGLALALLAALLQFGSWYGGGAVVVVYSVGQILESFILTPRLVGERIGKGRKLEEILDSMDSVAEGVPTTKSVRQLAHRYHVEMPITESVYSILFDGKDVIAALTDLMTREPKPEVR